MRVSVLVVFGVGVNRLSVHTPRACASQGQPGEQWTMFFKDPSGNNLEFKAMTKPDNLFAKYNVDEFDSGASDSNKEL